MRVRVLLFGVLKDIFHRGSDVIELPEGATIVQLLDRYRQEVPRQTEFWRSLACSVNQEYVPASHVLHDEDEVGLLPPVSGGSGAVTRPPVASTESESEHCRIVFGPIATDAILREIKRGEDGAAIIFEGIVRNNTRGRRTLFLDYEAYQPMALKQMESLACLALEQFKIRDIRIIHRLGRLEIGETSVLIAV